ncbi:Spc97/Spc98, partial [Phytophthora palmivora]
VLNRLTMSPAVPSVLGEFALVYDVKWPLGLVITSKLLDQYKQMHRFLLHIRLTSLEMRGVWGMLRMIRRQGQLPSELERLCGSVVYKMQAFVRAFNEAFATKVLMAAWTDLEHASQKATTLVELRHCHEEYVSVAVRCCFLDRPSEAIHSALLDTLATTWSLTGFVRAQVTSRALDETRMRTLCDEFNTALRALVGSLQSVTRDAERNTREFSECLLLRLNFNHFYDDRVTTRERVPGRDGDATVGF